MRGLLERCDQLSIVKKVKVQLKSSIYLIK